MKKFKIGVQLYSVRDDMEKDMRGTLEKIKEMGYDYVEFAGYFGKTAEEVRAMLDEIGLEAVSVHQGYNLFLEEGQAAVDYLKTLGVKYCAVPWMDVSQHKGTDAFDKTVEDFKTVSKMLDDGGIQLLYHNHDFEFNKFEDKFLLDWLYETLDEDTLKTEIDTCWVRYAGYDPCEYIVKYTGRSPIVHLKDFTANNIGSGEAVYALIDDSGNEQDKPSKEENQFKFRAIGDGVQDVKAIIEAAEKAGAEYLIVEQDQSDDMPALESVKRSREYLKSLGQ